MRLVRAWHLCVLAIGIAVAATAAAAHIEHGPIALGSLARYAAQATGVALALRAVALLLATFSMSLLVHRFNVSLMGVRLTTIACLWVFRPIVTADSGHGPGPVPYATVLVLRKFIHP